MPFHDAIFSFKSHGSYGVHLLNHLTADTTRLTSGEVTIVALVKINAYFACCLHLELFKCLLCILVCHNISP